MKVCVLLTVLFAFGTLKGVRSVIWPCVKDSDCLSVPTATCLNGNCRCPVGKVFSPDFSKCLEAKFYGDDCEESVQCSHMPSGANCNKGKCDCDEGLTYIRGRCRLLKVLGEDCDQDTDCWFGYDRESVECKNKKCACAEGYYERYANLCRRISMGVNHPCNVDQDCYAKENGLRCEKLKCVGGAKRKPLRDIAIQTSFDYFGLNTVPEGEEPAYKDDDIELTAISPETDTDTKSVKNYGDTCSKNGEPCTGLFHSLCVENRCYCKLGYYPQDGLCIAEIGEKAENQNLCKGSYQENTKICGCQPYFFYEPNLRSCRKPVASMEASCTSDLQCSPFGAAHCYKNVNETKRHCQCQSYARYDASKQLCMQKEGLGGHCDATKRCTVQHSVCSEQKCICAEQYLEKNNQCMPALGTKCSSSEECGNENAECVRPSPKFGRSESVCKCQVGFVDAKGNCLKEASEVGDECVDSEQCKPLLGKLGKCINQNCTCDEHHHLSFGKCEEKKVLGEKCSKSSECFTPEEPKLVECRNSVCHCQLGHPMDIEKQICIKPKKSTKCAPGKVRQIIIDCTEAGCGGPCGRACKFSHHSSNKNYEKESASTAASYSSGRPSCLKIITLLLIGSAVLITSAAIKQAYF